MVYSPLRYPGGKAKLYPFFAELIRVNGLVGIEYREPYAGGAGLALRLLTSGFVERISINDIDCSIYSFWISVLQNTDKFCALMARTPVTIDQWHRQRDIWEESDLDNPLALGFSAYFLNRTNRSGIIEGAGPIGGYEQSGRWKLGVRLVKDKQIENIKQLARYSRQIDVSNLDAMTFFARATKRANTLTYLDPPYFVKGRKLYKNFYEPDDHLRIAQTLSSHCKSKWVVSYDDVPTIRRAYSTFRPISYSPNYSAGEKTIGREVIFVSDALKAPNQQKLREAA